MSGLTDIVMGDGNPKITPFMRVTEQVACVILRKILDLDAGGDNSDGILGTGSTSNMIIFQTDLLELLIAKAMQIPWTPLPRWL